MEKFDPISAYNNTKIRSCKFAHFSILQMSGARLLRVRAGGHRGKRYVVRVGKTSKHVLIHKIVAPGLKKNRQMITLIDQKGKISPGDTVY